MDRLKMIKKLEARKRSWEIVVIGGGATGLGIALDAASRGYDVLLLEQSDFAKATSSRSTKLAHGGVRYLQKGDVSLVLEALRERGLMMQNAPHLVSNRSFVIPTYDWWDGPFYTVGMKVYDMMSGKLGLGSSLYLSKEETIKAIPTVERRELRGGVIYHDGQFDDARMAISLALTAVDYGATVLNYVRVTGIKKSKGLVNGVLASDLESGQSYDIDARVVINATGVFSDEVIHYDNPDAPPLISPSQGVHVVVDADYLPGKHAIMIPDTKDGRVLFAVPWQQGVILGTTDTLVDRATLEPIALDTEVDFILETASRYLDKDIDRQAIKSVFAGLRPLAASENKGKPTKEISRHHKILVSPAGLISVIGGKWTTYRKMAEDAVDHAILIGNLPERPCLTAELMIHSYKKDVDHEHPLSVYGSDVDQLLSIEKDSPNYSGYLSEGLKIRKCQVLWAVREEMARTVEDVLARRTRILFLDAREAVRVAEQTATLMAVELGFPVSWIQRQVDDFKRLASHYFFE